MEMEINFRVDMDQMGEELDLLGVENMVTLLFKIKNITHQRGLCEVLLL